MNVKWPATINLVRECCVFLLVSVLKRFDTKETIRAIRIEPLSVVPHIFQDWLR